MRYLVLSLVIPCALLAQGTPLREGCSSDEKEIGSVSKNTALQVQSAIAGGGDICYHVVAQIDGRFVDGYVQGLEHPAIARFEQERRAVAGQVIAPLPPPKPVVAKTAAAPPKPALAPTGEKFADFAERDLFGKTIRTDSFRGKLLLVCFWNPASRNNQKEFKMLKDLYVVHHSEGLQMIGISSGKDGDRAREALDDSGIEWPQVLDKGGLASRYKVNAGNSPVTIVVGPDREILAKGLRGNELRGAVLEALSSR
jgi:peroxiredoxin